MNKLKFLRKVTVLSLFASLSGFTANQAYAANTTQEQNIYQLAETNGIPPAALASALQFIASHPENNFQTDRIAFIDFSLPSSQERLFILDTHKQSVDKYLVAHGRGSGALFAESFSNVERSYKSSLGFYATGTEYSGKHGRSLQLHGLSDSNSNAFERAIVVHGADYVSKDFVKAQGRLGRSLGCPAVSFAVINQLIDELKSGHIIFAFR